MMIIKTSDLRDFFNRASRIKKRSILPILEYIELRVDGNEAILTKSNEHHWCRASVDVEAKKNQVVLLDEEKITALLTKPLGEFITITADDKSVKYTDGNYKATHSLPQGNKEVFPMFPGEKEKSQKSKELKLPEDFLSAIDQACIILTEEPELKSSYVFAYNEKKGETTVDSTNMLISFRHFLSLPVPDMILSSRTCSLISGNKELMHSFNTQYDFFDTGKTIYACIKPDIKQLPFEMLYADFSKKNAFYVKRSEIIDFCDLAIKFAPTVKKEGVDYLEISFEISGGQAILSYEDSARGDDADITLKIRNEGFENKKVCINCKMLMKILKTIPYEEVGICQPTAIGGGWFIFCDNYPEFLGRIQLLLPKQ